MWVAPTVVGRCTAGYWAVRCDTKGVTFLKSIWRTNVKDVELEGDILKDLGDKGVEHIPTVLCHGDVTREGLRNHQSLSSVFDHFRHRCHPDDACGYICRQVLGEEFAPARRTPPEGAPPSLLQAPLEYGRLSTLNLQGFSRIAQGDLRWFQG